MMRTRTRLQVNTQEQTHTAVIKKLKKLSNLVITKTKSLPSPDTSSFDIAQYAVVYNMILMAISVAESKITGSGSAVPVSAALSTIFAATSAEIMQRRVRENEPVPANYMTSASVSTLMAIVSAVSIYEGNTVTAVLAVQGFLASAGMAVNQYGVDNLVAQAKSTGSAIYNQCSTALNGLSNWFASHKVEEVVSTPIIEVLEDDVPAPAVEPAPLALPKANPLRSSVDLNLSDVPAVPADLSLQSLPSLVDAVNAQEPVNVASSPEVSSLEQRLVQGGEVPLPSAVMAANIERMVDRNEEIQLARNAEIERVLLKAREIAERLDKRSIWNGRHKAKLINDAIAAIRASSNNAENAHMDASDLLISVRSAEGKTLAGAIGWQRLFPAFQQNRKAANSLCEFEQFVGQGVRA